MVDTITKRKPKVNSESQKELDAVQEQFESFQNEVTNLTLDRMNEAPKQDAEPIHKISQKDIEKSGDVYLKPTKAIGSREPFNERFREDWNFAKEYVRFIAENREIINEAIEVWVKPFPGVPCEYWTVPVGRPIWAPRYVAERIKGCTYHRLTMESHVDNPKQNNMIEQTGMGAIYGKIVVDTTIQRLDALPVSTKKSIFMGASSF